MVGHLSKQEWMFRDPIIYRLLERAHVDWGGFKTGIKTEYYLPSMLGLHGQD